MENLTDKETTFVTEKDIDQILNSLSDDIVYEALEDQIKTVDQSESSMKENYIQFFTNRYTYILNRYSEYEDIIDKVTDIRNRFYDGLKSSLEDKFSFELSIPESYTSDQRFSTLNRLYEFFVIRYNENKVNIVQNYIDREMKELVRQYKPEVDKKDLTYVNNKKNTSKEGLIILCKLNDIISSIEVESGSDLVDLMVNDRNEIVNEAIISLVDEDLIEFEGDFFGDILSSIRDDASLYLKVRANFKDK
jgi:hypothetical protein